MGAAGRTSLPSVEQLHDLLENALPGDALNREGAQALLAFLSDVPPLLLPRVDEQWRRATWVNRADRSGPLGWYQAHGWQWHSNFPAWLRAHPEALLNAPGVVAALAGHADGYAREAAMRLLARMDAPLSTGILLLRADDWAPPVRAAALDALQVRLAEPYVAHWARYAALVDRLERVDRGDTELVARARTLLRTPVGLEAVREVLPEADRDTRLSLLQVVGGLPEPLRTTWLETFAADPHAPVRRRVAELLSLDRLHARLRDADAGVREVALRRLVDATPQHEVPGFLLEALLDPRGAVRALAQWGARRRGVDLGAAYLGTDERNLPPPAVRGWAAGVRELGLTTVEPRLEVLLTHPGARVRVEALLSLGMLSPQLHVAQLEAALLGPGMQVRAGEVALRAAHLLTTGRLERLWPQATSERQRHRLIRLAAGLPRFDAAALLLSWRTGGAPDVQLTLDETLSRLLNGFGTRYYTRPGPAQRAILERAVQTGGLGSTLENVIQTLLS